MTHLEACDTNLISIHYIFRFIQYVEKGYLEAMVKSGLNDGWFSYP